MSILVLLKNLVLMCLRRFGFWASAPFVLIPLIFMFSFASVLCSVSKNICSRRFLNFKVHFVTSVSWFDRNDKTFPFLHNILSLPYIYIIAQHLRFVNTFFNRKLFTSVFVLRMSLNESCKAISCLTCGEKLMKRNRAHTLICREILLQTA